VRKADNLPSYCAVVAKSGNLNFLEPFGHVQACNGIDLPFIMYVRCGDLCGQCRCLLPDNSVNISSVVLCAWQVALAL